MVESDNINGASDGNPTAKVPSQNDTTLNFTREFGAQLASIDNDVSTGEHEAIAALPSGSALLVVRRGPNAGARFLLDADITTVGRHPDADIFLDDVTVSRRTPSSSAPVQVLKYAILDRSTARTSTDLASTPRHSAMVLKCRLASSV